MAQTRDEPVQLLWTGGWDSSFRLMQALLVEGRRVQPTYIVNQDRRSTLYEVRAMETMRRGLLERLDDVSRLAPTKVVIASQFPPGDHLDQLRRSLLRRGWIGHQYVMLAGVAEALGWRDVELSIEYSEGGDAEWEKAIFTEARSDQLNESPEAMLFRFFRFPVRHLTKHEMRAIAARHGFLDLLLHRWFCHHPVFGKPCGRCRPCRLAIRDGVDFANPAAAVAAHYLRKVARRLRRARARLSEARPV